MKKHAWKVGSAGKSTSRATNPLGALHLTTPKPGAGGTEDPPGATITAGDAGAGAITPGAGGVGLLGLIKTPEIETIFPANAAGLEENLTWSTTRPWADNDPIRAITAIKNRFFIGIRIVRKLFRYRKKIVRKRKILSTKKVWHNQTSLEI